MKTSVWFDNGGKNLIFLHLQYFGKAHFPLNLFCFSSLILKQLQRIIQQIGMLDCWSMFARIGWWTLVAGEHLAVEVRVSAYGKILSKMSLRCLFF